MTVTRGEGVLQLWGKQVSSVVELVHAFRGRSAIILALKLYGIRPLLPNALLHS